MICGAAVSFLLFLIISHAIEDRARLRFERETSEAKALIDLRIQFHMSVLYGLRAFFSTQQHVSRLDFHRFVESLHLKERYPGFDLVNFAAYVLPHERREFEEAVRRDTSIDPQGYPNFAIKPAGERAEYHVLVYLEPIKPFRYAFGLDVAANPVLHADPRELLALQHETRDSGQLIASGRPIRVKRSPEYIGLALRLAAYRTGMPVDTVEQRRAAFIGTVGAGFNVQNLMKDALSPNMAEYMHFRLYDIGPAEAPASGLPSTEERLLFDNRQPSLGVPRADHEDSTTAGFKRDLATAVGGRLWEIRFYAPRDAVIDKVDAMLPWLMLLGGLFSTTLLTGFLYSLASSRSRAVAIATDMTKNLRESEASLADAQRTAHLGSWAYDSAAGSMTWSAETYRILGVRSESQDAVTFDGFIRLIHPDDRAHVRHALLRAIESKQHRDVEHRVLLADGTVKWVHTIVQGDAGPPVPGTIMDITQRKLAEQDLVENRALLNDAQKLAHVGCCQYNPLDGRVLWSDELYRIYGVNPETFTPTYTSALRLAHPLDRAAWGDALAAALRTGKPFTAEFRIQRPDGTVRHLRSLGEVINDAMGRPLRMVWSVIDITEHKETEHALRASADQLTALSRRLVEIQEAERRHLSRELHDRVGQNLTALSINLDMLHTSLSGDNRAEHRARLADSSALLEATVDSIENVMAELRPPMLDDYGLLPALHWYAKDFSLRTGIDVDVRGDEGADRLAAETEITLFRIAQEALTNVVKHAQARHATLTLDHSASHCTMTIADDGIGIDDQAARDTARRPRLGMVTMRERAQAIGARFLVTPLPEGGTQVTISIP